MPESGFGDGKAELGRKCGPAVAAMNLNSKPLVSGCHAAFRFAPVFRNPAAVEAVEVDGRETPVENQFRQGPARCGRMLEPVAGKSGRHQEIRRRARPDADSML